MGLLVNLQNNETGVINLLSLVTKIMPEVDTKIFENMHTHRKFKNKPRHM